MSFWRKTWKDDMLHCGVKPSGVKLDFLPTPESCLSFLQNSLRFLQKNNNNVLKSKKIWLQNHMFTNWKEFSCHVCVLCWCIPEPDHRILLFIRVAPTSKAPKQSWNKKSTTWNSFDEPWSPVCVFFSYCSFWLALPVRMQHGKIM